MFRSHSFHTIDSKGRFIIPARFKNIVSTSQKEGVMISNMDRALYAYTFEGWDVIEKKIMAANTSIMRELRRFFIGNVCECLCDKQGRILIPKNLRDYANLTKDIVVVGSLDHFEIWDRDLWTEENAKIEEKLRREDAIEEIASIGL